VGKAKHAHIYEAIYMIVIKLSHIKVHEKYFEMVLTQKKWFLLCRMVIEWREREHEEIDVAMGRDERDQQNLK
jgi:hypothetical protein